jgi:hypothetical protein
MRLYLRVSAEVPARYWFVDDCGTFLTQRPNEGAALNIGKGGMELVGKSAPPELDGDILGQFVAVIAEIILPNHTDPIRAMGRVVWMTPDKSEPSKCQFGIEFREMIRADADRIVDYIINDRIKS